MSQCNNSTELMYHYSLPNATIKVNVIGNIKECYINAALVSKCTH